MKLIFSFVKVDLNFNVLLDRSYGGLNTDKGVTGIYSSSGDFVFSGYSNSSISGDKTEINRGFGDVWIVGVNPINGNITWQKTMGGSSSDIAKYVYETPTSYKIFSDSESPVSGEKTVPNIADIDFWIFDLSKTVGLEEKAVLNRQVYPNPSTGLFHISLEDGETARIFDLQGKEMMISVDSGIIDLSELEDGVYILSIINSNLQSELIRLVKMN